MTFWAEGAFALVMAGGAFYAIWSRLRPKCPSDKSPKGIGVRFIQLVAVLVILPLIGILTLEGKLTGEVAGALIYKRRMENRPVNVAEAA